MPKKKYKEKEEKTPYLPAGREAKEPQASYGEKDIVFFNSLEEQENDNYSWLATLTPQQHLNYTIELIKRVYSKELKQHPKTGNKLVFD